RPSSWDEWRRRPPKIYIRTITWRDKTSDPGTADNRVAFRISTHAMYSDKRDRRDVPRDHEGGVGEIAGAAARTKFSVVVVALVTLLREREGDNRVSYLAGVRVHDAEVVPIGNVPAEGIDDELAAVHHVDGGRSGGASHVPDLALLWIEGEEDPPRFGVRRVELPGALAEVDQVPGDGQARLGGQGHLDLPDDLAGPGIGRAEEAEGMRSGNLVGESRAEVQIAGGRGDQVPVP